MAPGAPERGRGRPPSMADVAAHVGVSHQTVSRVLNDSPAVRPATRERVLAAIEELGYRRNSAARMLVTNRSGRIGIVAAHLGLHGPGAISAAVQAAGHEAGYEVALLGLEQISPDSLRRAVERLLDQAVEAVIVAVAQREALETTARLNLSIPVITVQGVSPGQPLAAGCDQVAGARTATGHLLDLGHARIAHVRGPRGWVEADQRREGWLATCHEAGVEPGPEREGDWGAASGYRAGLEIADDPEVTAVFAANDAMALGLLHAFHERGRRVPEEVSVIGFDDVPDAAHYWPALTTLDQQFTTVGRRAVELVVRSLAGEEEPASPLVPPRLVARSSTAPPPQRPARAS